MVRLLAYVIAAINTALFFAAIAAKFAQPGQGDMLNGQAGDFASIAISACLGTWYLGSICMLLLIRRGQKLPDIMYVWLFITGLPVVLFSLAMFLFLLPAFL